MISTRMMVGKSAYLVWVSQLVELRALNLMVA